MIPTANTMYPIVTYRFVTLLVILFFYGKDILSQQNNSFLEMYLLFSYDFVKWDYQIQNCHTW